ncbi:MAG TPA: Gfo/Idh/MocA family oxidoreductase [Bacteroides sp.]|nr:Gfo/Idh/MocA family oxidoreductase [Bacteroides sp.]
MKEHRVGIIMNGVTGRMGMNQHLMRSIVEIIRQGGVQMSSGERIVPDPLLVGRSEEKLKKLSERSGVMNWTTDLDSVLEDPAYQVYFDAQSTGLRAAAISRAVAHGKHIYCEKPLTTSVEEALQLFRICEEKGVKHGVVQDKLWLPGLVKLKRLIDRGFFGKILAVRGEFGYWVFEGHTPEPQRPSWNYRKEEDGGIIMDMLCHWRYVLDNLFGRVRGVCCVGATHIPERVDESGDTYRCTAEDAAYAIFELDGGIVAQFNSSWATRVRRDDLLTIQVDGSKGSAVAGLRTCRIQAYEDTPRPVWNPDVPGEIDFYEDWKEVYEDEEFENAFRAQWELFLKHVVTGDPFPWDLMEGAKGVQLAEKGLESWQKRRWVTVPELTF